jgi:hypothetical protein
MAKLLEEEEQRALRSPEGAGTHLTHLTEMTSELEGVLEESYSVIKELEQRLEAQEEWQRAMQGRSYELSKHVTTLSVASIAGVAALSRFFPASPGLTSALAVGLVCFSVAIVTGLLAVVIFLVRGS